MLDVTKYSDFDSISMGSLPLRYAYPRGTKLRILILGCTRFNGHPIIHIDSRYNVGIWKDG